MLPVPVSQLDHCTVRDLPPKRCLFGKKFFNAEGALIGIVTLCPSVIQACFRRLNSVGKNLLLKVIKMPPNNPIDLDCPKHGWTVRMNQQCQPVFARHWNFLPILGFDFVLGSAERGSVPGSVCSIIGALWAPRIPSCGGVVKMWGTYPQNLYIKKKEKERVNVK